MNLPDFNLPPIADSRRTQPLRVNGVDSAGFGQSTSQREQAEMLFRRILNHPQFEPSPHSQPTKPFSLLSDAGLSTLEFARRHTLVATERRAKRAEGLIAYG